MYISKLEQLPINLSLDLAKTVKLSKGRLITYTGSVYLEKSFAMINVGPTEVPNILHLITLGLNSELLGELTTVLSEVIGTLSTGNSVDKIFKMSKGFPTIRIVAEYHKKLFTTNTVSILMIMSVRENETYLTNEKVIRGGAWSGVNWD